MDNLVLVEDVHAVEQLQTEPSDEVQGQPVVVVELDQLVEVHGEQLENDALH